MAEIILKENAEKVLLSAYQHQTTRDDYNTRNIYGILNGTHKTYKYILITGLLAKATNEKINALALQAKAPIYGAYDARSLCHSVVVNFERDNFPNSIGGSNEPFLNKPARFTHLSELNAVRRGKDRETLLSLIKIFDSIETSSDANEYLSFALKTLTERFVAEETSSSLKIEYNPTLLEIYEFASRFIEKSMEGETAVLLISTLERLYYSRLSPDYIVEPHKVNQSGSSSKEVADIDIYKNSSFYYGIEVKDKAFSEYDLRHAMQKIQSKGGIKGQFIYGPRGIHDSERLEIEISKFKQDNFSILLQDIYAYAATMIFKIEFENLSEFINSMLEITKEINCKEETKHWIQSIIEELGWE